MKNRQIDFAAIVLAAGEGKRMKSSLPKVLHLIAAKPMISQTLSVLEQINPQQILVVVSPKNASGIRKVIGDHYQLAIQELPLGTADAVRSGLTKILTDIATVAVMYSDDTAFYQPETIIEIFKRHQKSLWTYR